MDLSHRHTRRAFIAAPAAAAALALAACAAGGSSSAPAGGTAAATPEPKELVLLAASSLTDAFGEIGAGFAAQPGSAGVRLTTSYGASSQLRTQLEQGAPADLFASADTAQMDAAVKAGAIQGAPAIFARNRLAVIIPKDNRAGVNALPDLARPGLKLVTTAPEVPVGNYTRQVLQKMAAAYGAGFDQKVLANVVSEEANVRQVVAKVQLGEADAGICYQTDVTPRAAVDLKLIEIPDQLNTVAEYPIAVARGARAPDTARRFVAFLLSPPGQATLARYGFIPAA